MIDYKKLKKLREETGVSVSLCRKALEESTNDFDAAKKKIAEWGTNETLKKSSRKTIEGAIFSYVHHNKKLSSFVELRCETDFVCRNNEFQKLGTELAMQVASTEAKTVDELLDQEYIREPEKKIKDLIKEVVLKTGENIQISRFMKWRLGQK